MSNGTLFIRHIYHNKRVNIPDFTCGINPSRSINNSNPTVTFSGVVNKTVAINGQIILKCLQPRPVAPKLRLPKVSCVKSTPNSSA